MRKRQVPRATERVLEGSDATTVCGVGIGPALATPGIDNGTGYEREDQS